MHASEVFTRNAQGTVSAKSGTNKHGIEILFKRGKRNLFTDSDAGAYFNAPNSEHPVGFLQCALSLHLVRRNAAGIESTNSVLALKDGAGVPEAAQFVRSGQACWTRANQCHALAGVLARFEEFPSFSKCNVSGVALQLTDGDRRLLKVVVDTRANAQHLYRADSCTTHAQDV